MKIKKIQVVTEIENVHDGSADVNVTLNARFTYVIEVATPQSLISTINETNQPFIEPGETYIIVKKLTPEIIEKVIRAFVKENQAYWLKLLHISSYFDNETLNNVRDQIISKYHLED